MDTVLTAVAAIALAVAAAMGVMLAKLVREERRRSEARVQALTEMTAERVASPPARAPRAEFVTVAPSRAEDAVIRPSAALAEVELFAERERSSPWGTRFAVIGALAAIVVLVGIVVASRSDERPAETPTATAATVAQPAPLELLSLRYEQQGDRMVITGLVRNPSGAAVLAHVTATAFLFGSDGTFLASGRAPLDYTTLAAGDESPFVISVPVSGTVARYRVGFRGEDGRVLAHVDRRAMGTLAERSSRTTTGRSFAATDRSRASTASAHALSADRGQ